MVNRHPQSNTANDVTISPRDMIKILLPVISVAVVLAAMSGAARADQRGVFPADMPASYRSECGDCHVAFAPDLLPVDAWHRIMSDLMKHYGVDATLEAKEREEIESFLARNAGHGLHAKKNGDQLRLTDTLWFHRRHGKVKPLFQDPRVVSKANCTACHQHADEGRYDQYTQLSRKFMQATSPLR
ncbi:dihem cytochrome c [mine drainage metagenome]|uniref:Dihem cytochrome c n=1 Tax=mine drainage metagenome TaxID=410659 RepID=A0A1J5TD84_9ZZZZ